MDYYLFLMMAALLGAKKVHGGQCSGQSVWEHAVFCPESFHQIVLLNDFNGDSRVDLSCVDSHGTMMIAYGNDTCTYGMENSYFGSIGPCPTLNWYSGDFNGDGRADVICRSSEGTRIDYANEEGDFSSNITVAGLPNSCDGRHGEFIPGDFNGDGTDEFLCHCPKKNMLTIVRLFDGGEFEEYKSTVSDKWCAPPSGHMYTGDFSGDGLHDVLCLHNNGTAVFYYSTGTTTFGSVPDRKGRFNRCRGRFKQVRIGDFNGDGYDDILCRRMKKNRYYIYYNEEGGFNFEDAQAQKGQWCGRISDSGLYAGDANGDGKDELICSNWDEMRDGDMTVLFARKTGL